MGSTLTNEFDVMLQFSEEFMERMLVLDYWAGLIPQRIDSPFNQSGAQGQATLDILIPSLSLHIPPARGTNNLIRLILPFQGTILITQFPLSSLIGTFAVQGTLTIDVPVTSQIATTGSKNTTEVVMDFRGLEQQEYQIDVTTGGLSAEQIAGLTIIIQLGAMTAMQSLSPFTILSVPTSAKDGAIQSLAVRTLNSANPADATCMALFIMVSKNTATVPVSFSSELSPSDDFILAISPDLFNSQKDAAIKSQFGTLPAPLPGNNSVIINSLSIVLDEGQLNLSGSGTQKINCWPDAGFDFSGHISLDGDLVPDLTDFNVDTPWWVTLVQILLPFVGTVIAEIIGGVITRMTDKISISGNFGSASLIGPSSFPTRGYFPTKVINYKTDIHREGLIVRSNVWLYTYVGNRRSKEIHIFSDDKWLSLMNDKYAVYLERVEDYLAQGYNGCWYCLRQLNTG